MIKGITRIACLSVLIADEEENKKKKKDVRVHGWMYGRTDGGRGEGVEVMGDLLH